MKEYTQQIMNFKQVFHKKIHTDFNGGQISADAGVLLLRETEKKIGLIERIAHVLPEWRNPDYVKHDITQLLTQRVFQIACGYQDGNDCTELRKDPIFRIGCNKLPNIQSYLASQPTMCRFENVPSKTALYRIGRGIMDAFIASYKNPPDGIILDFDETEDPTHGAQQLSLFNGYYDSYCYQPIHVFEGTSGKLITSILRPGKAPSGLEIGMILSRICKRIKAAFPRTEILFRGDGRYSAPEIFDCCDLYNVKFVMGLKANSVLLEKAKCLIEQTQNLYTQYHKAIKRYGEFEYQAKSWSKPCRVIVKVEVNDKGTNSRFIVTNLQHAHRTFIYERIYCGRGSMELMIKELKNHLASDRTSCHDFGANQFRLFLHSLAYILLHAFREKYLVGTELAKAEFDTIRLRLLKIGARVIEMTTKIKIHLASGCPQKDTFYSAYLLCCSP